MPYVRAVDVIFNFPNLLSFKLSMDTVPRKGEFIKLYRLKVNDFANVSDYDKYENAGFRSILWVVKTVTWTPASNDQSYVNIILEKAPEYIVASDN